jgi:hypothetical protein
MNSKDKYITADPTTLIKVKVLRKFLRQLEEHNDVMCGMKERDFVVSNNDPYFLMYTDELFQYMPL